MYNLQKFADRAHAVALYKKWKKDWANGGCYLHLESSEFIEALRGKGDSPPAEEAGDVLFALFTLLGAHKIPVKDVMTMLDKKLSEYEKEMPHE